MMRQETKTEGKTRTPAGNGGGCSSIAPLDCEALKRSLQSLRRMRRELKEAGRPLRELEHRQKQVKQLLWTDGAPPGMKQALAKLDQQLDRRINEEVVIFMRRLVDE
ncbi:MAG: hypothetical protein AAF471_06550 [Myxococcota bacterium]